MYAAVLMLAMTTGADSVDHGRRGCNGCNGGYAACSSYGGGCCSSGGYRSGYYAPGYAYGRGYYNAPGYANGSGYYAPSIATRQMPDGRQSFYLDANQQQRAMVRVLVPSSDAEVWFDGTTTQQRGMDRMFFSGPLENGKYTYTIRARWMENGQAVERERRVDVLPGQPATVNFHGNPGEKLSTPKGSVEKPPTPKTEKKIQPENPDKKIQPERPDK